MVQKKSAPPPKKPERTGTVHARLPIAEIARLDALARANNITRAAVVAVGCARILKTGL